MLEKPISLRDRYPHLGSRVTLNDFGACISLARSQYPDCYFEGSTGPERTIFNNGVHVGHCWPTGRDWAGKWHMRLSGPPLPANDWLDDFCPPLLDEHD